MQGAYSKNKKYQLPRPYGLKPKDNKLPRAYFTTPMKKMFGYLVLLFLCGTFVYVFGPKRDQSDDVVLSLEREAVDNFVNTAASSKKNGKLTVDQVIDETNKNTGDEQAAAIGAAAAAGAGAAGAAGADSAAAAADLAGDAAAAIV